MNLNDLLYIKYILNKVLDGLFTSKYIKKLHRYHEGKHFDFSIASDKQLKKIIVYAAKNSKYYSDIINSTIPITGNPRELIKKFPFLDKEIINRNKDSIVTFTKEKNYISHGTTGGSTGEPLGFYRLGGNDFEHQEFLFEIMGYKNGDKILAMDGTVVPDALLVKEIYWVKKSSLDLPYGSFSLSAHYLSSKTINKYMLFIEKFDPRIIRGYPSFIWEISKYVLKNSINLNINLKGIEVTSESYYDYQIIDIEKAFNTKVYSQYGHAEAAVFAYTIDETMMSYCSPLYGHTEIIGIDGKHVEKNEIGEIVVTGFFNYAMPFIRYKTGDLAKYHDTKDGIVMLERIYGRTQDYIYTKNYNKILLTALVFGSHYNAFNNIDKWQIVQNTPGVIIFRIIDTAKICQEDMVELKDSFFKVAKIDTEFEFVNEIQLTPRGKSKFLIQNLSVED